MPPTNLQKKAPKPSVYWVIWFAILCALPVFYIFLGKSGSQNSNSQTHNFPIVLVGFGEFFASVILRWVIIPRTNNPAKLFNNFIIALALAEACGVIGIIMGGQFKMLLFGASVLGVVQLVPVFVNKTADPDLKPPEHTKVID